MKPVIIGCQGLTVSPEERDTLAALDPLGFILFARNCQTSDQVRTLTQALRETIGRPEAPIFIDQEGGRVARLGPPHWPKFPPFRTLGEAYVQSPRAGLDAAAAHTRRIAQMLTDLGIDGNCSPVLDLDVPGASDVMGDRTFGPDPEVVTALGRCVVQTFLDNGVLPIIKHLPGHGRALVDPHHVLPHVTVSRDELEADFAPFRALRNAPLGMTAHVVYEALDPGAPASLSATVHRDVMRGALGFEGLLVSDDLAMHALSGPLEDRAAHALAAGSDLVLYCPGDLEGARTLAKILPPALSPEAERRWSRALAQRTRLSPGG